MLIKKIKSTNIYQIFHLKKFDCYQVLLRNYNFYNSKLGLAWFCFCKKNIYIAYACLLYKLYYTSGKTPIKLVYFIIIVITFYK